MKKIYSKKDPKKLLYLINKFDENSYRIIKGD